MTQHDYLRNRSHLGGSLKTKHTQAAKIDLIDVSKTNHSTVSEGFKYASYQYIETVLTKIFLSATMDKLFIRKLK